MPQPPAPGGGKKKTGLIVGAVAVVAAIGVGAYFVLGGSGGGAGGGLEDDGAHKLTTPKTVLGGEYNLMSDSGLSSSTTTEDLEKSGVKNGKSALGIYTTIDPGSYDPSDPSSVPDEFSTITFAGAYGDIADPEAALDAFFANLRKSASEDSSSGTGADLVGEPESVDLDGALMKCQVAKGENPQTKKVKSDWFCAWADHSTIAMVSPGEVTDSISKDAAVDLTTKIRKDVRVKA
jgi:hypothetical protein